MSKKQSHKVKHTKNRHSPSDSHPPNPLNQPTNPPLNLLTFTEEQKFLHEPLRLQIVNYLAAVQSADMKFLQRQLDVTWGNISFHSTKLEEHGYINVQKEFIGKKPYTVLQITKKGKKAFENYKNTMKAVLI